MKYAWTIVAGEPGKPAGVVGTYRTRQGALANWPRYAAYLRRDRVDEGPACKDYPDGCWRCDGDRPADPGCYKVHED